MTKLKILSIQANPTRIVKMTCTKYLWVEACRGLLHGSFWYLEKPEIFSYNTPSPYTAPRFLLYPKPTTPEAIEWERKQALGRISGSF